VSADTLLLNYGTTNVAPTQKDEPHLSSNRRLRLQTHKWSWNKNMVASAHEARNQERLCWQGPASVYCYAMNELVLDHVAG
jgi:hypothetical protein